MPIAWETIEPLLMRADKPARYVGGEFNQVVRENARARCCLAFPDTYEIGMSYHGYRLLYERINANPGWAAERAYAPWPDFEALMRENKIPLFSLETRRPLADFDWIGFTLQHEVNFTNVLNMIDLAGLPLESAARTATFPLIIGGGEGAYSPEPLAPFLDAFVIGDGEEVVGEIMEIVEEAKESAWDKPRLLRALAALPGLYVPAFYEVDYLPDGRIAAVRNTLQPDADAAATTAPIKKRHYDVARDPGSLRPVVPLLRTVHDRLTIEVRRGCVNGCRFCQAGMINRPVHERPLEQIVEVAREGLAATGYDEISLLSLSSADYTEIGPLIDRLNAEFGPQGVSVTLPSLRINSMDIALVDRIAQVRKSGFTFAPEAGTSRLRQVINKPVDQEHFFELIEDVFRRGWQTVKFYFMIGLPTETDEDLEGIVEICRRAAELGWRYHKNKATTNVTLSPFVPKSNTPFQWEPQLPREELERRFHLIRDRLREQCGKQVSIKSADMGSSFLEAVLARGDRRLAVAIRRAWELGARFDGWTEHFNLSLWQQAFSETGTDPAFYANRARGADEVLPWEHIDPGLGRRFLAADLGRSRNERAMEKCDTGPCAGCNVCDNEEVKHTLARDMSATAAPESETVPGPAERVTDTPAPAPAPVVTPAPKPKAAPRHGEAAHASAAPVQRLRLHFSKLGALRYLSHLDFAKVMNLVFRRAGLPLAQTQGFNPGPRVSYAPPLSLGMAGEHELVDLLLTRRMDLLEVSRALHTIELDGFTCLELEEEDLRADSLEARIIASCYRVEFPYPDFKVTAADLAETVAAFRRADTWPVTVMKKNGTKEVNLKHSVRLIDNVQTAAGQPALLLAIHHATGLFVKPHHAVGHLLERPVELGLQARVARFGFYLDRFGQVDYVGVPDPLAVAGAGV